jgi:hypothetical protein
VDGKKRKERIIKARKTLMILQYELQFPHAKRSRRETGSDAANEIKSYRDEMGERRHHSRRTLNEGQEKLRSRVNQASHI